MVSSRDSWTVRATISDNPQPKLFLLLWMLGWAAGEVAVGRGLLPHLGWLRDHWKDVFAMLREWGRESMFTVGGEHSGELFQAVWLFAWTIGGVVAGSELIRRVFGQDTIELEATDLVIRRHSGLFGGTARISRDSIQLVGVSPKGDEVFLETAAARVIVTRHGTKEQRQSLVHDLRAALSGESRVSQQAAVIPEGWESVDSGDGWEEIIRLREVFYPALMSATQAVCLLVAAAAPQVVSPLMFLRGIPQLIVLGWAIMGLIAAYRTVAITSGIRVRSNQIKVMRGYPVVFGSELLDRPTLTLLADASENGATTYRLLAESGGRSVALIETRARARPVLALGEWVASRLGVQLSVPEDMARV